MSKVWTLERRQQQAVRIQRWKPWEHSTGPKSAEGKALSARNSYRFGEHSRELREIRRYLAQQNRFLRTLEDRLY